MKTYGQVEELLHLFVTLALLGCQWSASHTGSFICDKRTLEPVWMFWRREKSLALAEVPNVNCPALCLVFIPTSIHKKFIKCYPKIHYIQQITCQIMVISGVPHCVYLYLYLFASVLSHLVTMDLSGFVQVEYSPINNEHKLDKLTNTT